MLTYLPRTARTRKPKKKKKNQWGYLKNMTDKLELSDFYKTLHLITAKFTFFPHITNIIIWWYIEQSEKFQRIEIKNDTVT